MLREAPDLDLGRGGDTVQRTWTLAGKEGKSPLENIPRIIPLNGKRSSRPATHHVRPLRTACSSRLVSSRIDSTRNETTKHKKKQHEKPPRASARACGTPVSLFNFTNGVPTVHYLSRIDFSSNTHAVLFYFPLTFNKRALILSIKINGFRPIYFNNPHQGL